MHWPPFPHALPLALDYQRAPPNVRTQTSACKKENPNHSLLQYAATTTDHFKCALHMQLMFRFMRGTTEMSRWLCNEGHSTQPHTVLMATLLTQPCREIDVQETGYFPALSGYLNRRFLPNTSSFCGMLQLLGHVTQSKNTLQCSRIIFTSSLVPDPQ